MTAGGITFGFVAMTESVNSYDARLGGDSWAVGRASQRERIQGEIKACRSAGAEVVIAFPHWGEQYMDKPGQAAAGVRSNASRTGARTL